MGEDKRAYFCPEIDMIVGEYVAETPTFPLQNRGELYHRNIIMAATYAVKCCT